MHPVDRAAEARADVVGYLDQQARVFRLLEMPVAGIPIAEVVAELDVFRHEVAKAAEPDQDPVASVLEVRGHDLLQDCELDGRVPLHSQFGVLNGGRYLTKLFKDPL